MSALAMVAVDGGPYTVTLPPRPYPGLRHFNKSEWPIFFGRERTARAVVTDLIQKRVILVHGDSGCGKSSLVRAAVQPMLEQDSAHSGIHWTTCASMPREAPLLNLAKELARLGDGSRTVEFRRALNLGKDAPRALADLLGCGREHSVCILIDQFEETFEHARRHGPEEGQLLVDCIVSLFNTPVEGLYVLLTMRSEYIGACARFNGLAELVNSTQYLLPRMKDNDLLRAVREPAALYGGEVTRELAQRLITDAGDGFDRLPLIQHGLMLLHERHAPKPSGVEDGAAALPAWRLGLEHYTQADGLAAMLSRHANSVKDEAEQACASGSAPDNVIENLFRALTDINSEGNAVRRPQTFERLARVTGCEEDRLARVIDRFRADGVSFLTPFGTERIQKEDLIDVGHEALIRCWDVLADPQKGWLITEFRSGLIWRALLVQTEIFERDPANVLSAATFEERERWLKGRNAAWAERYGGGWERVQALMAASAKARRREMRAKWYKLLAPFSVALLVLLATVAWLAMKAGDSAETATRNHEAAKVNAAEATKQAAAAERNAAEARKQTEAATRNADEARKQSEAAKRNAEVARKQTEAAERNRRTADKRTAEAQASAAEARKQTEAAERNARTAEERQQRYVRDAQDFLRQRDEALRQKEMAEGERARSDRLAQDTMSSIERIRQAAGRLEGSRSRAEIEAVRADLMAQAASLSNSLNTLEGALSDGGVRVHTVSLVQGVRYSIGGTCDSDCTDLDLYLLAANGSELTRDTGTSATPRLDFTPPTSGNYAIRVRMASCTISPCGYTVRINQAGDAVPVASNSRSAPSSSRSVRLEGSLDNRATGTHQSIPLVRGVPYLMRGTCDSDCTDLGLSLLDSSGNELTKTSTTGATPSLTFTVGVSGDYSLRVRMAKCSISPCSYTVTTGPADNAPEFEPLEGSLRNGGTRSHALTLAPGPLYTIRGACDRDCNNLQLSLLDSTGAELTTKNTGTSATPTMLFAPPRGGDYSVRVRMESCTVSPCVYRVTVERAVQAGR